MSGINIVGPGGIIEGTTNDVDVNINLDAALDFDGSNDYVDLNYGNGVNAQAGFSVSAWVKVDALGTNMMWIGSDSGTNQRFYIGIRDNYFSFGYGSSGWSTGGQLITAGDWYHVCVTTTSGTQKLYVNGVEITGQAKSISDSFTLAGDLYVGRLNGGDSYNWDGKITDVKIFGDVLTAAEVREIASKPNYDITAGSIDNLTRWFKSNAGSGTNIADDSGNSGTAADISGATWVYDQFYVDLQNNNTGGSGTFTVTQGKVEGLALTSLDFSGDTQLVSCTSNTFYNGRTAFSVSAWFYHDNSHDGHLLHTIVNARNGGNNGMALSLDSTNDRIRLRIGDGTSDDLYTANGSTENDKWFHVVATRDASNNTAIYINGELSVTGSSSKTISISSGNFGIGGRPSATDADEFSGKIRDVGCWSYALSADQVAALCAGQYNVTPNHQYKLDEGSGTTVNDTGTETAANGTITGATYVNGTLDLDGALTVSANGTLSAPRGVLNISATILANGNYIHNNGTFAPDLSGTTLDASSTQVWSFYDLDPAARFICSKSINVENELGGASQIRCNGATSSGGLTITMGTTSSAGNIAVGFFANWSNNCTTRIVAADTSGINRWTMQSSVNLQLGISTGEFWEFANGDIQISTLQTKADYSNSKTITLTGDMEFDAVTVSSGDTFDINGKRVEFGGFFNAGTLQDNASSGGQIYARSGFNFTGGNSWTGMDTLSTTDYIVTASDSHYINATPFKNVVVNTTGAPSFQNYAPDAGTSNLILANGTMNKFGNDGSATGTMSVNNITIATGANMDNASLGPVISCAGDFTTSGGLIGKSAVVFDHDTSEIINSTLASGPTSAITLEAWVKSDDVTQYQTVIVDSSQVVHLAIYNSKLYIWTDTDASPRVSASGVTTLTNNKWHHLAMTWDAATDTMLGYVDGKLEVSVTSAGTALHGSVTAIAVGRRQDVASQAFDGVIAMTRIFNVARTSAQLRTDMFNDFANMSSTTGLLQMFQFDEGTGTSVDDVSANSNTGTITGATWAGAGTFTQGTSTVDLTGTGTLTLEGDIDFNILKCAAATKTTTIKRLSSGYININTNLYKGAGTLSRDGSLSWRWSWKTGTGGINNSGLSVSGASYPVDLSDIYVVYYHDATLVKEVKWEFFINASDTTLAANQEATGYWHNAAYQTDVGDYNLKCGYMKFSDSVGGKFTMGAGDLWITNAGNGLQETYPSNSFTAGPGATVSGSLADTNFKSQNNFVIVGKAENLNVTNEELSVTGQVINCTGEIHQQFPTIDHDQQLDFDTADDRDIILGRDLDKNTELINS